MIKELNLKGLACPKPVIAVKNELNELENCVLKVIVDNSFAKENIIRFCENLGIKSNVLSEKDNEIVIQIKKGSVLEKESTKNYELEDSLIFISSDKFGDGEEELGKILMKGYIYTLTECMPYPKNIVFANLGVKLATENEETVQNLKILEENGVEIFSCGACLDYYNLKDNLNVGKVTNMYSIVEMMQKSKKVISM